MTNRPTTDPLRVLVVDDDDGVRYTLTGVLEDKGLTVLEACDGEQALAIVVAEQARGAAIPLVISDLRMPKLDGLGLLAALRARTDAQTVPKLVMITAHGTERLAVEAIKAGAYDYFRKPFEIDELSLVIDRALAGVRLEAENRTLISEREQARSERGLAHAMVFESAAMSRLALLVHRVAPRDVTVLITGESGTGKERVAEAIVAASARADRPFIRFNCAALSADLAEAELFGHAKGSFTGAHRARAGLFREADGGTLLLDEVGELAPAVQAKLLRVLQSGEVRPVGQDLPISVDVRLLAATHRDLPARVRDGSFREDLFYRLEVVTLAVPALRERPDDIAPLARHFLRRYAERFGVHNLREPADLLARLRALPWPGNVRQLENTIESLVALSDDGELDLALLPGDGAGFDSGSGGSAGDGPALGLKQKLEAYEKGLLISALEQAEGNRSEAARALGIGRATLHDKLKKYALEDAG